jgi:hypothetical protein
MLGEPNTSKATNSEWRRAGLEQAQKSKLRGAMAKKRIGILTGGGDVPEVMDDTIVQVMS